MAAALTRQVQIGGSVEGVISKPSAVVFVTLLADCPALSIALSVGNCIVSIVSGLFSAAPDFVHFPHDDFHEAARPGSTNR
jgi:hypothetical protein